METELAFVGELREKRVRGSVGRTIRLIRLFEVSTRLVFVRRLIFPCVLIRADALLATFVLATLSSTREELLVPHEAFANSPSGQSWVVSAMVLAGRACSFDPLSSHLKLVVALFSKTAGRIRFADVLAFDHTTWSQRRQS
jgi:hypothetical protein